MTGRKESSKLPTTRRVRNFDPSTPIRRSAKSLIRFRASTKVSVTNSRNTNADRAARKTVCCVVLGLIKGRSNEDSESKIANSTRLPADSRMISRLRSFGPRGLPEAIGQEFGALGAQRRTIIASGSRMDCGGRHLIQALLTLLTTTNMGMATSCAAIEKASNADN